MTGPIVPVVASFLLVYGGREIVRFLSRGFTQVRAERSVHRLDALKRVTRSNT